jgi:hypothetical protein
MFIDTLKAIDQKQLRLNNLEAADILHNVTQAYGAIMKRFEQSRADHKTLYVIMGEYHDRPSHHIAHTLLIRALSDVTSAPIITALECPIDLKASDYPKVKNKWNNASAICQTSAANIACLKEYITSEYAPFASQSFEASLCHQQDRIVTIFNDIARNDDNSLDIPAPQAKNNDHPHDTNPKSSHGVALRNIHMSEHLIAAAEKFKAPLALQVCGQAHINGSQHNSPKESITGLLKAKDHNIFAVFWGAASAMPMHLAPCEHYISKNMPERFISYQLHNAKEDFSAADLENYNLEKDYVQGVYQALGIKPPL